MCKATAKCYWDDDERECASEVCVEDADCIGQKFDYDDFEVAEEGDMYCEMYEDGNECEPAGKSQTRLISIVSKPI